MNTILCACVYPEGGCPRYCPRILHLPRQRSPFSKTTLTVQEYNSSTCPGFLPLSGAVSMVVVRGYAHQIHMSRTKWYFIRSSCPRRCMDSRIAFSSRPTVDTKYPRAPKCSPVKSLCRPPTVRATGIALWPLMYPITWAAAYWAGARSTCAQGLRSSALPESCSPSFGPVGGDSIPIAEKAPATYHGN